MEVRKVTALVVLFVVCCAIAGGNDPIVEVKLGKIRGKQEDGYFTFHNIPYAEPPLGNLRFEPPVPFETSWDDVRDGTQEIVTCVQFMKNIPLTGTEDCLYLHVATPSITCEQTYPVRVHLHNGALMFGSPGSVDPSILVKRGMIIVTIGARLGAFGYLSSGDEVIPGNMALKDHRVAMKWIKDNIQSFCGHPGKFILSGSLVGGSLAHFHLLQKPTEEYVSAVISSSGVGTNCFTFEPRPLDSYNQFSNELNCPDEGRKACLQSKSVEEIIRATLSLQYFREYPTASFPVVVEPANSADPFMTEHPEEIMRNGKAANVPWLLGYTDLDGSSISGRLYKTDENGKMGIDEVNKRWMELAPYMFNFNHTTPEAEWTQRAADLKKQYLGDKDFSEENHLMVDKMWSDLLFDNELRNVVELHRKYCPGKLYVYLYRYPHKYGIGNWLSGRTDLDFGADAAADTIFTLPLYALKQTSLSEKDKKLSEMMIEMILSFANTGIATFGGVELPLNTPTERKAVTINENCYSFDGCLDENSECTCQPY